MHAFSLSPEYHGSSECVPQVLFVALRTGQFDQAVQQKGELEGKKLAYLNFEELEAISLARAIVKMRDQGSV